MLFTTFVLKNLIRRPVRSALTVLGLAVAVGSMIALPGISHNIDEAVLKSLDGRGVDLVVTSAGKTDQLTSDLDESLADRALNIPGVTGVSTALVELVELTRDSGASINVLLHGWTPDNFVFDDIKVTQGRKLAAGDRGKVDARVEAGPREPQQVRRRHGDDPGRDVRGDRDLRELRRLRERVGRPAAEGGPAPREPAGKNHRVLGPGGEIADRPGREHRGRPPADPGHDRREGPIRPSSPRRQPRSTSPAYRT